MAFDEADYLLLSGIQHFCFCRRQWALIHIENLWQDNLHTVEGELLHQNAHDKEFTESRKDLLITRGMSVFSAELGVSGECDVLEFHRQADGISLAGRPGLWQPYPIEYKRSGKGESHGDELQLCGEAMCIEEMLCCSIPEGAVYQGTSHKRTPVALTDSLRQEVRKSLQEMHELFRRGYTPKGKPTKACNACSLKKLCLPGLMRTVSVANYLLQAAEELS